MKEKTIHVAIAIKNAEVLGEKEGFMVLAIRECWLTKLTLFLDKRFLTRRLQVQVMGMKVEEKEKKKEIWKYRGGVDFAKKGRKKK